MQARIGLALLIVPLAAVRGQPAQDDALTVSDLPIRRLPIRKPASLVVLKGMPYSAESHSETTEVLADGTRIVETGIPRKEFRDAQGRTRREQVFPPTSKDGVRIVTIDDPAANVEYVLEEGKRIAHRFRLNAVRLDGVKLDGANPARAADAPALPTRTEPLGVEVIQGVRAEGTRQTITFPAIGDRAAREVVVETWIAPDLKITMRQHTSDPMRGETTMLMAELRTEEPPAGLFQVPADFRTVDEPGDFAITYSTQSQVTPPVVISRVGARYTEEARKAGTQGTVLLAVAIDRTGRARDVQVERSVEPGLDQEAVKAVRQWKFRPAQQDGRPVRVSVHVEVTFSLLN